MIAHRDAGAGEVALGELANVHRFAPAMPERQAEHLVEVAVVDVAAPVDRHEAAAHHRLEVLVAMRGAQELHVAVELALRDQHGAEALNRHVGERVKPIEGHALARGELALVIGFELRLRRRQCRSLRVVHEVEREPAPGHAVAERVQRAQRGDAALVDAGTALAIDELTRIAGQRRDDLHPLGGEELRESFLSGLLEDGEVAPVDDVSAERAGTRDEAAELRMQLGRAAGDVERLGARILEKHEHVLHDGRRHHLGALRSGIDVAMHAALVAAVAKVDLQRLQALAPQGRKAVAREQRQRGVH